MPIKSNISPELQDVIRDAWLNINIKTDDLYNPLGKIPEEFENEPHHYITWLFTRPEYFSFICEEILNVKIIPTQALILQELWNRKFPMLIASRGFGKSFMLAVYAMLRILLMPKRKVIIVGAAFRQSKVIFDYMQSIYDNAPILRDVIGTSGRSGPRREADMCRFHINESVAIALPIGDGSKIRGQRAHDIVADEFDAIPRELFETVIAGFAAVKAHPIDNVIARAREKKARELGLWEESEIYDPMEKDNQIILSGTAGYSFNHFGEYWKRWRTIVRSQGNKEKLAELFRDPDTGEKISEIPAEFDYRHYSIIRIPYELIPQGFMDAGNVARSRATMHSGIYQMEYGAVFSDDSNGFYKRSLIESCVISHNNKISFPSGDANFNAVLRGAPGRRYVIGVDPASEIDNFSIVVLELWPEHRRVVYVWTTNREQHKIELQAGLVKETDFYAYCSKKIRDLAHRFPCDKVAIDSQGGGVAIMEALHDADKIPQDDKYGPIWPTIERDRPLDSDTKVGAHIIDIVNFASAEWTSEANHGMRKDLEDKVLIFPFFDAALLAAGIGLQELSKKGLNIAELSSNVNYDTLEDNMMEQEELKNELSMIVISKTNSGRDRWDTPEVKLPGNKKGRLRKDRYSALLMANMSARQILRKPDAPNYSVSGGFADGGVKDFSGPMYAGNEMFSRWADDFYRNI